MKIRINDIECRFAQSRYEIVKFSQNEQYGKQEEYAEHGWILEKGFFVKDNHRIQAQLFNSPETCYTIATLRYDSREGCCDMETVGSRLLDLNVNDRKDFFDVYQIAEDRIKQKETSIKS